MSAEELLKKRASTGVELKRPEPKKEESDKEKEQKEDSAK